MSDRIKDLLNEHHLKLVYKDIESEGYIVYMPDPCPDFVFVKDGLSDEETEKVILHELGHAEADDDTQKDYKDNPITRICCESGAKNFVVHEQIKKYIDLGNDVSSANWLNLAKYIGTDNYCLVQEELLKYGIE